MKWQPTTCFKKCLDLHVNGKNKLKAVYGGSSAGKTVSIIPILHECAINNPGETITIVSDTLANLKLGAMKDFKDILMGMDAFDPACWLKSESRYHYNNGSKIEFIGADDEAKMRGGRRDRLYVNEANRVKYEVFNQLKLRTKKDIWIDWNPSGKFWYNQYVEENLDHDSLVVNFKDNEWIFSEEGRGTLQEFEEMEANKHLSDWHMNNWRVYGLGEWGTLSGSCIKTYEVVDSIPLDFELVGIGLDFGTVDPNAAVALYKNNYGRWLFDEIIYKNEKAYGSTPMMEGIRDDIKNYYSTDVYIYADYAAFNAIQYLRSIGLGGIRKCKKGPDSIKTGIDLINELNPFVTSRSKNLLDEFGLYRYKTDKNGDLMEGKYEGPDHLVDACRYVLSKNVKKRQIKVY